MKRSHKYILIVLSCLPTTLLFNNCAPAKLSSTFLDSNSLASLDPNHPGSVVPSPAPSYPLGKLNLPLDVKETAGVGATNYPMASVIPLPYGAYQDTSRFRIVDSTGATVPAQFEIMNRWWGKDKSLRNIIAHFQPSVAAFTTAGTGITTYTLKDDGQNIAPVKSVLVSDSAAEVSVSTGALQFKILKSPFKIVTPAGELKALLKDRFGVVHESLNRADVKVEIEERGPLRSVIKLSSVTVFKDATTHRHGFAIRLYAYAGQPLLKVDYQLQNSDKKVRFSGPLYFESLNLEIQTGKAAPAASVKADKVTADFSSSPVGAIKAPGVNAMIRNFYETWPNGLEVTSNGHLKIELWPEWSAQYYEGQINPTGLFWLEDMQHTYKEVLLDFSTRTDSQLTSLAKTFQHHPVATLKTSWYAETKATLDMGGGIPVTQKVVATDVRRPVYDAAAYNSSADTKDVFRTYQFGWTNFGLDVYRKLATAMTGGVPPYDVSLLVTENPADYFKAENTAAGEINIRPQWMEGFNFVEDNPQIRLTENPYSGGVWRAFDGHGAPTMAVPYLANTGRAANARDDQHGWFYPVEYGYAVSGNLWVKDWYKFVAEFRKIRLNNKDPWPDMSGRAVGHSVSHALQAFRVTGDPEILPLVSNFLRVHLAKNIEPTSGVNKTGGSATAPTEAPFQAAYMLRAFISYNEELPASDPVVLAMIKNYRTWNLNIANYSYYIGILPGTTPGQSNGGSDVFADIFAWYMIKTGDWTGLDHMKAFYQTGIPAGVGDKPYNQNLNWKGTFVNRFTPFVLK